MHSLEDDGTSFLDATIGDFSNLSSSSPLFFKPPSETLCRLFPPNLNAGKFAWAERSSMDKLCT